jgi:spermidine synthase
MTQSQFDREMTRGRAVGITLPGILPLIYGVFFLSGFSALTYQTAWQRMLGLFAGSDAVAATLVVGAFLFGLGVGSMAGGAIADRLSDRRAVQAFAACEFGIALFAVFSPALFYDGLFGHLAGIATSPGLVSAVVFPALLPPTLLMGMSLPLLSKAVVGRIETASTRIGWLYGINTLGAGLGALLAGFVLLGTIGYARTVDAAAAINVIVGLGALTAALSLPNTAPAAHTGPRAAPRLGLSRRLWLWCGIVFVSGFINISLEIVWFRVLGAMMQSSAYAFSLILAIFLVADAVGIVLGAMLVRRVADPLRVFLALVALVAAFTLAIVALAWGLHGSLDLARWYIDAPTHEPTTPGKILRLLRFGTIGVAFVLPPALLLGMTFPVTQKAVQDDPGLVGYRVGVIQLFNILGNTAGAVVTGLVLLALLGTTGTLRIIGVVGLLFALALLLPQGRRSTADEPAWARVPRGWGAGLAALLAAGTLLFPGGARFWGALHGAPAAETAAGRVEVGEDETGVAVMRDKGALGHALYVNGYWQGTIDPSGPASLSLGLLGPIVHPKPQSVLLIGLGTGVTLHALGANPDTRTVRVVEIADPVYRVVDGFAAASRNPLLAELARDPRLERTVADGRHVLFTEPRRYDVIVAETISPHTSHSGLLFSEEFFRQVKARLNEGGICVQWAPTARTVATFARVFPYVVHTGDALLGSSQPIPFSLKAVDAALEGRYRAEIVNAGVAPAAVREWLHSTPVRRWVPSDVREDTDINTDLFPKDEYHLNN